MVPEDVENFQEVGKVLRESEVMEVSATEVGMGVAVVGYSAIDSVSTCIQFCKPPPEIL